MTQAARDDASKRQQQCLESLNEMKSAPEYLAAQARLQEKILELANERKSKDMMSIFVRALDGKSLVVNTLPDWTVQDLKAHLCERVEVPVSLVLFYVFSSTRKRRVIYT